MDQNFQQFVDEIRTENRSFRKQFLEQHKAEREEDRRWFHDRSEVVWAQIRALEKSIEATDKSLESSSMALGERITSLGERITSFMTVIRLLMTLNAGLFVTVITLLIVRAAQQ